MGLMVLSCRELAVCTRGGGGVTDVFSMGSDRSHLCLGWCGQTGWSGTSWEEGLGDPVTSCGCYNDSLQIQWPQTSQLFYLQFQRLEAQSQIQ